MSGDERNGQSKVGLQTFRAVQHTHREGQNILQIAWYLLHASALLSKNIDKSTHFTSIPEPVCNGST